MKWNLGTWRRGAPLGVLLGVMLVAGVALAHAPKVTLDPLGDLGPYAPTDFPVAYNVTGDVCHTPNVTSVSEVKLFINNVQEGATFNPNFGNIECAGFSLPWSITGPGTFTVKVTARHGNDEGEDWETIEVTGTVVVAGCPAAPAIAAHYMMNDLGFKPVTGKFKGIMKAVAGETGVNGSLWAGNACEPGYADAVRLFVDINL